MTKRLTPNQNQQGSADIESRVRHAFLQIQTFMKEYGNERFRSLWSGWAKQFADLMDRARQRPEVVISLVGGTGAGKSTLLNALIGVRVLPVSNMRACTAAICEVAYGVGPYRAQ